MSKKGGGSTTTVQKSDPWEGQQGYLKDVFSQAQNLYNSGQMAPDYYSGNTVAGQSDWTKQALQMQADRAQGGSGVINSATNTLQGIMDGSGLSNNTGLQTLNTMSQSTNPYIDTLYNRANNQAQASLNAGFANAGRYGSGAHEAAAADAANNLASQMYGNAYQQQMRAAQSAGQLYNQGIGQQIAGTAQAQSLGNQAYTDAAKLSEAGGVLDDYSQQLINADIDRYNYGANQALNALSNYNQMIQGSYGGTSTTTGQQSSGTSTLGSSLSGIVGGGMTGAALSGLSGAAALASPWTLGGAALGGLLGLL